MCCSQCREQFYTSSDGGRRDLNCVSRPARPVRDIACKVEYDQFAASTASAWVTLAVCLERHSCLAEKPKSRFTQRCNSSARSKRIVVRRVLYDLAPYDKTAGTGSEPVKAPRFWQGCLCWRPGSFRLRMVNNSDAPESYGFIQFSWNRRHAA